MEYIVINGQKRLNGTVDINGAKNAAVAIIPAAIACGDICVLENLPNIQDVNVLIRAIQTLGVTCEKMDDHTMRIDSRNLTCKAITYELVKDTRASYYLLGALLGRFRYAEVPMPGGCNFGSRPIDLHFKGFNKLGAECKVEHGVIKASAEKLTGDTILLDTASVGATINIMIAAVYAEGVTQIENAAKEPHVVDTANFLNQMGAKIKGAGTDVIRVTGVDKLHGGTYSIIPDQIEAGTYMMSAAITGGDVTLSHVIPKHMESLSTKLAEMNCEITAGDDSIRVVAEKPLAHCDIKTAFYPGFPTDLQPQMTALLCKAGGNSNVTETVWENRFQYVNELKRLGAEIKVEGRTAMVSGEANLTGAEVNAMDLRAGAALVVAGLASKGETIIGNVKYLDRGYERFEEKFRALGADIKRIERDA